MEHTSFHARPFVVLLGLGLVALFLSLPFPPSLALFLPGLVVLAGAIGIGLVLASAIGLGIGAEGPQAGGAKRQPLLSAVGVPLLVGAGVGLALLLGLRYLFLPLLPQLGARFAAESAMPLWERGVLAFDAAVLEEVLYRLFLLTLLAWLLGRIWHTADGVPRRGVLWAANALVAFGFGLAHLPNWSAVIALTPLGIAAVVFLNGIAGFVFGYLYFARGLPAAMLAHFAGDVVLHVIGPGLLTA